ncbi:MAG: prepilin-type N-terminal cleavage/methylation domain-containing protein [Acidobacteria bacterium]|nr:prepilin-type N-terminal cleavage/methylation domain-containing protein [Acidobacteriota bacterium]
MDKMDQKRFDRPNAGFSVVELLVVLALIAVMAGVTLFYTSAHKKLYQPDEQALQILDMMQEARQRALTQRRTMRVEVNLATNTVKLYDENKDATTSSDDFLVRSFNMFSTTNVKVNPRPSEIGYTPPETMPVPDAVFKTSVYTPSISQSVCTIRFLANGTAVDAGTNATGAGAVPTGVTLYIWSPNKTDNTKSDIARAITVLGPTGVIRFWEFDHSSTNTNKWKDSRRSS